ncbi:MAG: flagellar basal body rod protein FlgC [Alphaproteobacteria bacterium]|nr:flagellar basal body rod protein FlgC [Alphaproteobacteria bacterium]
MDLQKSMSVAASGMKAQGTRLKIVAENLANADTIMGADGFDPYRRKVITFKNELDRASGANVVKVNPMSYDQSDFRIEYRPTHPKSDPDGYVKMPNVNSLIEVMDMREAQRSYEANVTMIEGSRNMIQRTIDLLRT